MIIYTGNSSAVLKLQRLPLSPAPPMQGLLCQWFSFTQYWTASPFSMGALPACPSHLSMRDLPAELFRAVLPAHCWAAHPAYSQLCRSWISIRSSQLQREITVKQAPSLHIPPVPCPSLPPLCSPPLHWNQAPPLQPVIKNHGVNLHKKEAPKNGTPRLKAH